MGDIFKRVLNRMREGVHGVHAPAVAGIVVRRVTDTVNSRVAQVDIGCRHVDFGAQNVRAVWKLTLLHALKKITIFCGLGAADAHDEVIQLAGMLNAPVAYS